MIHQHQTNQQQSGFTLIELSIVLIIIGLLVGGILVGQDLIRAGEIRATISQYEKYNTATNTFRSKYGEIPGDMKQANANAFGFYNISVPANGVVGGVGNGDGNTLLQSQLGTGSVQQVGETVTFWRQLSESNLIDGSFGGRLVDNAGTMSSSNVKDYFPEARLGRGNYWMVQASSTQNYYFLTGMKTITDPNGIVDVTPGITPLEAYNIDVKLDDGKPNTGIIFTRGMAGLLGLVNPINGLGGYGGGTGWVTTASLTAGSIACQTSSLTFNDASNVYNLNSATGANTPACQLLLRFN
ncbi:MAG: prepilin-type N-terminal cleavage/methylation domain-containing protein [Rickettsiales bacterium]|jgi:prepilin-type N-terminal cleavage/methylation domain-containing protein|nr:prepilin-type N-terminal cleavage/methylation domain-containing protein [Rickettsiales bacterium]